MEMTHRPINLIAQEIREYWTNVSPHAEPYLEAMETLESVNSMYFLDSAYDVVARFLCNASTWRGEEAKRIKRELNLIIKH